MRRPFLELERLLILEEMMKTQPSPAPATVTSLLATLIAVIGYRVLHREVSPDLATGMAACFVAAATYIAGHLHLLRIAKTQQQARAIVAEQTRTLRDVADGTGS